MSTVESLQAAIEKMDVMTGTVDADSALALHNRTVDSQVALLEEALNYATDWYGATRPARGAKPESIYRKELALALAILDGDS